MPHLEKRYVWEVPVRVTHWVNFVAIGVLSVTGIYMGNPRTFAQAPTQYFMGWMRFTHFVAGYVFSISVLSRIYWAFVGNRYAGWREFVPFISQRGRHDMKRIFRFYLFLDRTVPHPVGHNALAGVAYLVVFLLYLVMMVTGFALYSEYAPGSIMDGAFGWLFHLFSNRGMRLTHHMIMWFLIAFAIHHIYSAWLMDVMERGGAMSAIFGGYKAVKVKEEPPA